MSHIFISYSKKNKIYTDELVNFLEKAGFNVWYDGRIDYGTSWQREIFEAIQNCAAFIVVMSPESYESDWVEREYLYADKLKKPQFPLLLAGEEFPFYVSNQFTDVRGGKLPPDNFLNRLEQYLKRQNRSGENLAPPKMTTSEPLLPQLSSSIAILPGPFEWIEIPAGKVNISGHGEFSVPKFSIAKYPITNAQFAVFIEDGGYKNRAWWTEAGWDVLEKGYEWDSKSRSWKATGKAWTTPRYWSDKKWNGTEYPVVGMSWYEAIAFCRWLSKKTGENILLPTEQEWQRAAQGDTSWAYPWGNEFDATRCNSSVESASDGTSPVTQYQYGASPYGVLNMSGNIWEWCLMDYASASIGDINSTEVRVLRGGSWWSNSVDDLCVSSRFRSYSNGWGNGSGFRCARFL